MIKLEKPIPRMDGGEYTHAGIRKLAIDMQDEQIHFVVQYAEAGRFEAGPIRRFYVRKGGLWEGGDKWDLPPGFGRKVLSGVAGPVVDVLEGLLVAQDILKGTVNHE